MRCPLCCPSPLLSAGSQVPAAAPVPVAAAVTETKAASVSDDAPLDLPVVGDTPTPEAQRVMMRQVRADAKDRGSVSDLEPSPQRHS